MKALKIFTGVVVAITFLANAAFAEELTWRFKSEHENIVSVELYSDQRNHIWPGNDEVYTLNDYQSRSVTIACIAGERICYGAWVKGTESSSWGAGVGGKGDCKECCYSCDGGQTPILVFD